jgi:hypothetical protein
MGYWRLLGRAEKYPPIRCTRRPWRCRHHHLARNSVRSYSDGGMEGSAWWGDGSPKEERHGPGFAPHQFPAPTHGRGGARRAKKEQSRGLRLDAPELAERGQAAPRLNRAPNPLADVRLGPLQAKARPNTGTDHARDRNALLDLDGSGSEVDDATSHGPERTAPPCLTPPPG